MDVLDQVVTHLSRKIPVDEIYIQNLETDKQIENAEG